MFVNAFVNRESGGAFGVREAAMEEQYFRRLVYSHSHYIFA